MSERRMPRLQVFLRSSSSKENCLVSPWQLNVDEDKGIRVPEQVLLLIFGSFKVLLAVIKLTAGVRQQAVLFIFRSIFWVLTLVSPSLETHQFCQEGEICFWSLNGCIPSQASSWPLRKIMGLETCKTSKKTRGLHCQRKVLQSQNSFEQF